MLTLEQIKARKGRLTASRVSVLMSGDAEDILRLWEEMTDQRSPDDLSHIWAVRLGETTEKLQCDWFQEKNGLQVTRRGEVVTHPIFDWAACTLDGWVNDAT